MRKNSPFLAFAMVELLLALAICVVAGLVVWTLLQGNTGVTAGPQHSLTIPATYGDWGNVPVQIGAQHELVEYYVKHGSNGVPGVDVEFTIEKKNNVTHVNSDKFSAVKDEYSLFVGTIKTDSDGLAFLRLRSNVDEKANDVTIKVRVKGLRDWHEDDSPKTIPVVRD